MTDEIPWGPTGELVYNRTYARTKPDGSKETWPETVERVVDGNLVSEKTSSVSSPDSNSYLLDAIYGPLESRTHSTCSTAG